MINEAMKIYRAAGWRLVLRGSRHDFVESPDGSQRACVSRSGKCSPHVVRVAIMQVRRAEQAQKEATRAVQ